MKHIGMTLLAGALALLSGCASSPDDRSTFHDPNMDFSVIHKVAVLPFANLTTSAKAEDRVRDVFMTMLQATGAFYVIPPGEVARAISRTGLSSASSPTPEEVVKLAKNLEADAIFTGSLLEYGEVHSASASANVISVNTAMMEAQTGKIVWSAGATEGGIGAGKRLFGGGGEPMNVVTEKAIEDLLHKLFK